MVEVDAGKVNTLCLDRGEGVVPERSYSLSRVARGPTPETGRLTRSNMFAARHHKSLFTTGITHEEPKDPVIPPRPTLFPLRRLALP
jgi:hypothetical protein